MSKNTFKRKKSNSLFNLVLFIFASIIFVFGSQISAFAEDLGFGPALIDTGNCLIGASSCNPDSAQEVHLFQPGANSTSAIDASSRLIDTLYLSPPNSSIIWAYDQYQRIQDKELLAVYAQTDTGDSSFYFPGLGYNVLMPMMGLWQWSRNVVYIFYIIIVIILSFLILFRSTLSGQNVITILNSIPSLILSLVLVSLSYPIAGFFVDLIYIGSNVAQGLLITSEGAPGYGFINSTSLNFENQDGRPDVNFLQPDDPNISVWAVWGTSKTEVFECGDDPSNCLNNLLPSGVGSEYLEYIGNIIKVSENVTSNVLGQVSQSPLLNLILGLTALMASFKLFMSLLKSYVMLTLSPVYLPFLFLMAAIPSKTKSSIVNALKPLLAASLSFIAIYVLFLLMIIIGNAEALGDPALANLGRLDFTPPLLGYGTAQISADNSVTRTLINYILFLGSPAIPDMINNMLNVQTGSQFASTAGQNASKGFGNLFGGVTSLYKRVNPPKK